VSRIRDIRAETLILWGKQDHWLPVSFAYEFRELIPNARVIVYPDAGHVPMEERAEETERDVRAFLEGRRPRDTAPAH
jgi:pimeloyl-ACP methyl ester carboxylesterase